MSIVDARDLHDESKGRHTNRSEDVRICWHDEQREADEGETADIEHDASGVWNGRRGCFVSRPYWTGQFARRYVLKVRWESDIAYHVAVVKMAECLWQESGPVTTTFKLG